eukprot:3481109-Prymnesium_polylepis.1
MHALTPVSRSRQVLPPGDTHTPNAVAERLHVGLWPMMRRVAVSGATRAPRHTSSNPLISAARVGGGDHFGQFGCWDW